jgi:hypothetical protein
MGVHWIGKVVSVDHLEFVRCRLDLHDLTSGKVDLHHEPDRCCAQDLAAQLYDLELLNARSHRFLELFFASSGFPSI